MCIGLLLFFHQSLINQSLQLCSSSGFLKASHMRWCLSPDFLISHDVFAPFLSFSIDASRTRGRPQQPLLSFWGFFTHTDQLPPSSLQLTKYSTLSSFLLSLSGLFPVGIVLMVAFDNTSDTLFLTL